MYFGIRIFIRVSSKRTHGVREPMVPLRSLLSVYPVGEYPKFLSEIGVFGCILGFSI